MNARAKPLEIPPDPTAPEWRAAIGDAVSRELQTIADDEPLEETPADRVARMLADSHDDPRAVVKLYQTLPGNKRAWCNDYPLTEFEMGGLDMIRRDWGPGDYTLTVYGTRAGTNQISLRAREMVTIRAKPGESAFGVAAPMRQTSEIADALKAMSEQQALLLKALTERPQADPMADMQRMFTMMGAMREAMGIKQSDGKSNITEMVSAMRALREASEEFGPAKAEPETLMGMLPQVLDTIKMATQRQQPAADVPIVPLRIPASLANLPPMQPQAPQAQQPQAAQPVPAVPSPTNEELQAQMIEELRAVFAAVIAFEKAPPEGLPRDESGEPLEALDAAAGLIYEKIPDELLDVLRGENWLQALGMVIPEAPANGVWLAAVRARVLEYFAEDSRELTGDEAGQ